MFLLCVIQLRTHTLITTTTTIKNVRQSEHVYSLVISWIVVMLVKVYFKQLREKLSQSSDADYTSSMLFNILHVLSIKLDDTL